MIGHRDLTPRDYWDIFRRRRWVILAPAIACPVLALALTWWLPSKWTSTSLILIEQQRVPSNFVQPVITENVDARIATMQEQVLSRTRLEPIVKKYNLFKSDASNESMEQLVGRLHKAINLAAVTPGVAGYSRQLPGFSISVTLGNPHVAQQVCTDITSMFIEENLRQREKTAEGTTRFLQSQLNDAKQGLNEQDARLAAFKEKYFGMLPDQVQSNLNVLGTLNTQLQSVTNQLNRVAQDKSYHEALLSQMIEKTDSESPVVDQQAQLKGLQNKLVTMENRYTSDYPDVVTLKQEIKELKERIQKTKGEQPPESQEKVANTASGESPEVLQLRHQIKVEEQATRELGKEEARLQKQIKVYEARLQLSPKVELEYKEITRDHDTALSVYNSLLKKRDESRMATDLEREQQGEQFVLIDPANLPRSPSFPKRSKFGGAGLAGGLVLGCALALLLEKQDKAFWNELDVEAVLGTYPVGRIPLFDKQKGDREDVAVVLVPDVSGQSDTVSQG